MSEQPVEPKRSYGCSFGCGRPFDYVLANVEDSEVLFLDVVCFLRLVKDMVDAMVDPEDGAIAYKLAKAGSVEHVPDNSDSVKPSGHNAPIGIGNDDAIEEYDGYVLEDELSDEFK